MTRTSKAYTPIEHHYYGTSTTNTNQSQRTTVSNNVQYNNTQENTAASVCEVATQKLSQIFGAFAASSKSSVLTDDSPNTQPKDTPKEELKPEEAVKKHIENFDSLPKSTQEALVKRYNTLIGKNGKDYNQDLIKLNLNNYLKGMGARNIELKFGLTDNCQEEITINGVSEALDKQDTKAYLNAYRSAAEEFIAQYDANGDGKINLDELKAEKIDLDDPQSANELAEAFLKTINRDSDAENLDTNEVAAYLLSMARINDCDKTGKSNGNTAATITSSEYATTMEMILSNTDSIKEYNNTLKEQTAKILANKTNLSFNQFLQLQDLSTLTNLSKDEINILQEFKNNYAANTFAESNLNARLENNYKAFIN